MKKQKHISIFILFILALSVFFIPSLSWSLGSIEGHIRSETDEPIEGAKIETDLGIVTVSYSDGFYNMTHLFGTYSVIASAPGYESKTEEVTVIDGMTTNQDFTLPDAPLTIQSVSPNNEEIGNDLDVTIRGKGFDENIRLSMVLDSVNRKSVIGSVDSSGHAYGINVIDYIAYLADGELGLKIIDVDPFSPGYLQIIESVDTPGDGWSGDAWRGAHDVTVIENTAFVANYTSGLQIIDVDPSSPDYATIIGAVDTPGLAYSVTVMGNTAYVADGGWGLQVIDVTDPKHPSIITYVDTLSIAYDVAIIGDTAYVADYTSGLQIIDVNPSSPNYHKIIGSVDTPGEARGVTVLGDTAYVADYTSGLQIIDVDPSSPDYLKIVGAVDTPGEAYYVTVTENTAYVADGLWGVQIIDISDPEHPNVIGTVDTPYEAHAVTVLGNTAYMADYFGGLQIIDVSDPKRLPDFTYANTPGCACSVSVAENTAYVADDSFGLQLIDINPSSPAYLKIIDSVNVDISDYANDTNVINNIAYVAFSYSGLQIINIDPSSSDYLKIIGAVNTPGEARGVTVLGDIAYVADYTSGLQIIDVNPSSPDYLQIIGSVNTPGYAFRVAVINQIAYVADGKYGLQIIDVNPSSPDYLKIIGAVDTPGLGYWGAHDVKAVDNIAYVADSGSGLQIIDVNPASLDYLNIIGSVVTPGSAAGITVIGNMAYIADAGWGVQVVDVTDRRHPVIIAYADTPSIAYEVTIIGDIAYVADSAGLQIVNVPVEIDIGPQNIISDTEIEVTLLSPSLAGNYSLICSNGKEFAELVGAVSFLTAEGYQELIGKKAIIVAGYRSYPNDSLWDKTRLCVNMAYKTLKSQGYDENNIYYLSPGHMDVDGDGQNGMYGQPDLQTLSDAIRYWAQGSNELLLFMTDHGGTETFQLNQNQILSAQMLDGWLDEVQSTISDRIIIVYDACKSGSFLEALTPPADKERIVITSTTDKEYAWFEQDGVLSFSYQFWAYLQVDAQLVKALNTAGKMMKYDQTAQLDANGDGEPNQKGDNISDIVIGRGRVAGAIPPVVGNVSGKQILNGSTSASFWADNVRGLNPVEKVWAVIIPPGDRAANDPVINFPKVELVDDDLDGTYQATYNEFTLVGTYRMLVYAKDEDDAISQPREIRISQTAADIYEDDDKFINAGVIVLNDPDSQLHNFHDAGDEDWVKFYGLSGQTYTIEAYNLGDNCDAVIELYATDGTTLLAEQDTIGDPNADELLDWSCIQGGIYYVKIKHYSAEDFGDGTEYDLKIYRSIGPIPGFVNGHITDALSGYQIADVKISTDTSASALSLADGAYVMVHPPGTYDLTAQKSGYDSKTILGVHVSEGGSTPLNIVLMPVDTDSDGISDAVENATPCLDANDDDSDDDGIIDGNEDADHDGVVDAGETDPCEEDTDNDGLLDGTEIGLTAPQGSGTDLGVFIADADPTTTTDPTDDDSDNDGWLDGEEDQNYNGRVDVGEKNPNLYDAKVLPHIPLLLID